MKCPRKISIILFCSCSKMSTYFGAEVQPADLFSKLASKLYSNCDKGLNSNGLGCILWLGPTSKQGYGIIWVSEFGPDHAARYNCHRLAYMIAHRLTPQSILKASPDTCEKMEVSHLCHKRTCVNPDHLVLETHGTNAERRHCNAQGLCTAGHEPHCLFV